MENNKEITDLLLRTSTLAESLEWIRDNMPLAIDVEERLSRIERTNARHTRRIALVAGIVSAVLSVAIAISVVVISHIS